MSAPIAYVKAHWYYFAAGLVGLFVLYELVKALNHGGSASASSDVSGGAAGIQALTAAADQTNAQVNAVTTQAAYQASTQNNAIAAELQLGALKTAAQLDATNHQTAAAVDVAKINADAGVQTQQIITSGQVQQTQIEGATLDTLGAQKQQVNLHIIDTVAGQIKQIMDHSKHASQDYTAFAPIIALETGQPSGPTAAANAASRTAASGTATTAVAAGAGVLNTIITGLFA